MSPRPSPAPAWRRWRDGIVGTPANAAITALVLAGLGLVLPGLLRWAVLDATWRGDAATCRARDGACWAFIGEKLRFIAFGFYPPERQGQVAAALVILVALLAASTWARNWGRRLAPLWAGGLVLAIAAMGGLPGPPVATDRWGGVAITLGLAMVALAGAFPMALALAFARRSRYGIFRTLATGFIEIGRGVPLVAVLYVATLLLPLALPAGAAIDKLLRTTILFTLFVACYMAEIVRGGLQAVPAGQGEAAAALGLSWWRAQRSVVLPQALRVSVPALVNLAIAVLQDTTLVTVIGLFDLLNTARAATTDPAWLGFYDEAYVFVAAVYFVACFAGSRYSLVLERRLARG